MDNRPLSLLEKLEIERGRRVAAKLLEIEGNPLTEADFALEAEMDELGLIGEDRLQFVIKRTLEEIKRASG